MTDERIAALRQRWRVDNRYDQMAEIADEALDLAEQLQARVRELKKCHVADCDGDVPRYFYCEKHGHYDD